MSSIGWPLIIALVAITGLATTVVGLLLASRRAAAERAATQRRFSDCMNLAPFCAYMKDAEGRYVYTNPTFLVITRRVAPHVTSVLGQTDADFFDPQQARHYMEDDREVLRQQKPIAFDNSTLDRDGTVHQWFSVKFPWVDEHGRTCVAGMSIDTSEVERARASAKASEARCALALEAGRMGTFTLDLATQMLDTSPLFATLHGRADSKTILSVEESLADVHPDDRGMILQTIQQAIGDQAPSRIAYRVVLPDRSSRWVELMGRVFTDESGRPAVVHGVGFDISEERAAFEELARRKATLRRLIEVQENERQTLCHELHDGLIQYAIAAKMQLESARDEADATLRGERIDAALECLERGIVEGRQVIRGVRPAVLDDLGLSAAIDDLVEQMAAAGITVDVSLAEDLDTVPTHLHTTIYRVVQEALTNVRKHSGMDRATVEVRRGWNEVLIRIRDHGKGCDVNEARIQGFGLIGMTERVKLAGGTLWIESQPGKGTQVNVRLPDRSPDATAASAAREATSYAAAAPGLSER